MRRIAGFMLAVLFVAGSAWAQDFKGTGRLTGRVVDEQGKGLENVLVQAKYPQVLGAVLEARTDKNGQWMVSDVAEGAWDLTFDLDGYVSAKASTDVDETGRAEPVRTTLKKQFDPNAFIQEQGKKAAALMEQKKYADARAVYEGIISKVPAVSGQMQVFLAQTYSLEGKPAQAAERLKAGLAKDPGNQQMKLMLVTAKRETGALEEAQKTGATLDESKLTDPGVPNSFGLALVKKQRPADALPYFDKAIERFPRTGESYYYRALALVDLVNAQKDLKDPVRIERLGRIKADLTKYLELAPPTSADAENARKLLEQIDKQIVAK